jgi:hypothetical protein
LSVRFWLPVGLRGTFAPFFRASLRPIAIACFRLFTVRPEPLLSVLFFRRCIVDFTFLDADLPYFAMAPPGVVSSRLLLQLRRSPMVRTFLLASRFTLNRFFTDLSTAPGG